MVSNARLDLPLPLGPVMTVIWPSGRSRSIPLRLFWRAPRISTQPRSGGAVRHGFSVAVEPTADYPIERGDAQISGPNCRSVAPLFRARPARPRAYPAGGFRKTFSD